MFYNFSKILWLVLTPSTLIGLMFLLGLLTAFHFKRFSRFILLSAALLFVTFGFLPFGYNLVHYWETRHAYTEELPAEIDGIIVLGGAIETELSRAHSTYSLNESGDRLSRFTALALKFPEAKLVFAGGGGRSDHAKGSEAYYARSFFQSLGLPVERIIFEDKSRNTYENADFSKMLVEPVSEQKWILVTSAFHMPRSVAVFETLGWDVIPFPVDFKTGKKYRLWSSDMDVFKNLRLLDIGTKEAIGIAAYRLTGKIK